VAACNMIYYGAVADLCDAKFCFAHYGSLPFLNRVF
jgi:hypothetical protein